MMNQAQIELLQRIGLGVMEAVEAADDFGAPAGPMFAAMQAQGASLNQFQSIMGGLIRKGMLTEVNQCFYITTAGRDFMQKLQAKFGVPA